MAGTFTRFMVCDAAKAAQVALPAELRKHLNRHSRFLFLVVASLDKPYLNIKTGNIRSADVTHYETKNTIAGNAHEVLKKDWGSRSAQEEVSWFGCWASSLTSLRTRCSTLLMIGR